jgi:hypothetical protein
VAEMTSKTDENFPAKINTHQARCGWPVIGWENSWKIILARVRPPECGSSESFYSQGENKPSLTQMETFSQNDNLSSAGGAEDPICCPESLSDDLKSFPESSLDNLLHPSLTETLTHVTTEAVFPREYYHLSHSSSKGQHYLATKPIPRGTILLREKPYYTISNSNIPSTFRERGYSRLAYATLLLYFQQSAFTGKHISKLNISSKLQKMMKKKPKFDDYDLFYLKVLTHTFDIDSFESDTPPCTSGFYEIAQNFNHSCQSNCKHRFNLKTNEIIVVANENIEIGEELTISYMGPQPQGCPEELWYRTVKKSFLERYGESCCCERCVRG